MTYTIRTEHDIAEWPAVAVWEYDVTPEAEAITGLRLIGFWIDKTECEWPDWLPRLIRPSDDALLEHAAGCREYDRAEVADARRDAA